MKFNTPVQHRSGERVYGGILKIFCATVGLYYDLSDYTTEWMEISTGDKNGIREERLGIRREFLLSQHKFMCRYCVTPRYIQEKELINSL